MSVILRNPFEVPAGNQDEALAFWERAADVMRKSPGFTSTRLHGGESHGVIGTRRRLPDRSAPFASRSLPMGTHPSFSKAREEFGQACNNPDHTLIETAPVDVNAVLQTYYSASEPVRLTKTMLWDAEAKKAWDPMTYIPGVVREGSSWGRKPLENGEECFLRESQQLAWRADIYGQVLEEVYLSPKEQTVLFLGRAEFLRDDGSPLQAGSHQPLFHVEHAVSGTDSHPENLWRIVHLTSKRDDILLEEHLAQTGTPEWLRRFVAICVEKDLGVRLTRK